MTDSPHGRRGSLWSAVQGEARRLGHNHVGTEHLLLALVGPAGERCCASQPSVTFATSNRALQGSPISQYSGFQNLGGGQSTAANEEAAFDPAGWHLTIFIGRTAGPRPRPRNPHAATLFSPLSRPTMDALRE